MSMHLCIIWLFSKLDLMLTWNVIQKDTLITAFTNFSTAIFYVADIPISMQLLLFLAFPFKQIFYLYCRIEYLLFLIVSIAGLFVCALLVSTESYSTDPSSSSCSHIFISIMLHPKDIFRYSIRLFLMGSLIIYHVASKRNTTVKDVSL